jgi:hypothetical protein
VALDDDDVAPPGPAEVVGDARSGDAAADDDATGALGQ